MMDLWLQVLSFELSMSTIIQHSLSSIVWWYSFVNRQRTSFIDMDIVAPFIKCEQNIIIWMLCGFGYEILTLSFQQCLLKDDFQTSHNIYPSSKCGHMSKYGNLESYRRSMSSWRLLIFFTRIHYLLYDCLGYE